MPRCACPSSPHLLAAPEGCLVLPATPTWAARLPLSGPCKRLSTGHSAASNGGTPGIDASTPRPQPLGAIAPVPSALLCLFRRRRALLDHHRSGKGRHLARPLPLDPHPDLARPSARPQGGTCRDSHGRAPARQHVRAARTRRGGRAAHDEAHAGGQAGGPRGLPARLPRLPRLRRRDRACGAPCTAVPETATDARAATSAQHIALTLFDLGLEGAVHPFTHWNQLVWGNVGITTCLFVVRSLWFLGIGRSSARKDRTE